MIIPEELWHQFRLHRKKIGAPMTEYAETLILRKLEKWQKENGADPVKVLEESIERGWAGIFLNGHGSKSLDSQLHPKSGQSSLKNSTKTCKKCGTAQWASLDRYGVCGKCNG